MKPSSSLFGLSADLNVATVLKKRLDAYGYKGSVQKSGSFQVVLSLPQSVNKDTAIKELTRLGLLEFCEPIQDPSGNIAVVQQGTVQYQSQSCDPVRDAKGNIVVNGGSITYVPWATATSTQPTGANVNRDQIVWQPAKGDLNGQPTALTGKYLKANTAVVPNPDPIAALRQPFLLTFEFNNDGATIFGEVTDRLSQRDLPLAVFLDGQPIMDTAQHVIAPSVRFKSTIHGVIAGLSEKDAQILSKLLNAGPMFVSLREVSIPSGQ